MAKNPPLPAGFARAARNLGQVIAENTVAPGIPNSVAGAKSFYGRTDVPVHNSGFGHSNHPNNPDGRTAVVPN